jgi:hypothetical protein
MLKPEHALPRRILILSYPVLGADGYTKPANVAGMK